MEEETTMNGVIQLDESILQSRRIISFDNFMEDEMWIGSATAKGIAYVLQKPLIPVPTLEGLAYRLLYTDGVICPMLDARRNQVYAGLYERSGEEQRCSQESSLKRSILFQYDIDCELEDDHKNDRQHDVDQDVEL